MNYCNLNNEEVLIQEEDQNQVKSLWNKTNNQVSLNHSEIIPQINNEQQYYKFFEDIIPHPKNYTPKLPSYDEFKKHKIIYLKGNKFHQALHSYDQTYIRVKNTERQGTIVNYIVIIGMFQLEMTLLNIDQNGVKQKQQNIIGSGKYGTVRIQQQNNRIFAVKRKMFKNKQHLNEFDMMVNKYQIDRVIAELAIYKICSLLKIGPAAETQIGFDLICYKDCIEFQIQYCVKIEYNQLNDQKRGIFVDKSKFEKQIKQCLLTLHFYRIIHKDIKPANILFSIKYNKYVFTDFGISHPILEQIGQFSITHLQGTQLYMSKQMRKIEQGKAGYVHLYGNDVYSLAVSFQKKMIHQNIEQGMKQFNQKIIKQYNTKYEYEYLKLKYYCIKPDSKMEEVQNYWKCMNINRKQQLLMIVDKSIEYHKIKSVYNYLSKQQEFKEYNLENLRIQSESIKNIKIDPDIKQVNELKLKNTLRVYGYSQQVKDIIIKLKLQQKYKYTLQMIDKKIDKINEINYRDMMFGNHRNYIKKVKNQILECQKNKDYRGIFQKYMIILQYGNQEERIQTIKKLDILNYERKKEEYIEQMIRVTNIEKNKEKIKYFKQQMKKKNQEIDKIITEKNLDSDVGGIYNYIANYQKALQYYTKSLNMMIIFHGQQHPSVADTYNNIAGVYKDMGKYEKALQYYTKSVNMDIAFHGQQHPSVAGTYNNIAVVYHDMGKYEKALQYYTKSVNMKIKFHGQQHPSIANTYNNISSAFILLTQLSKSLKYCYKSIQISSNLPHMQWPQITTNNYHLLSSIFLKKKMYIKSLNYEYTALDTFVKTSHLYNYNSSYSFSKLADIYHEMNRFIQSYFFYRLQYQILIKHQPLNHVNVQNAKDMMKKIKKSIPFLINNFKTNIQFMNNINSKYKKLSKHNLLKLLLAKKWELRFEEQHRERRDKYKYLKCVIQIYLCYKYLGYTRQMKKVEGQMKEELLGLEQSQQKSIIKQLIQVISSQ